MTKGPAARTTTLSATALDARVTRATRPLLLVVVRKGDEPSLRLCAVLDALPADVQGAVDRVDVDVDDSAPLMDRLRIDKVPETLVFGAGSLVKDLPTVDVARFLLVERTTGTMSAEYAADFVRAAVRMAAVRWS